MLFMLRNCREHLLECIQEQIHHLGTLANEELRSTGKQHITGLIRYGKTITGITTRYKAYGWLAERN